MKEGGDGRGGAKSLLPAAAALLLNLLLLNAWGIENPDDLRLDLSAGPDPGTSAQDPDAQDPQKPDHAGAFISEICVPGCICRSSSALVRNS